MRVLRHFMHLSQETLGTDVTIDISEGTCTMKYSPKVQEHIAARHPGIREIHPLQPAETMQGLLEIIYNLEQYPQGGSRGWIGSPSSPRWRFPGSLHRRLHR